MNKEEKLTLLEGSFLAEEAHEILMNLFSYKMNFHQLKNFSSVERFGKDDKTAKKRITELLEEIERAKEIISIAKAENKQLIVNSEIIISLSNDE